MKTKVGIGVLGMLLAAHAGGAALIVGAGILDKKPTKGQPGTPITAQPIDSRPKRERPERVPCNPDTTLPKAITIHADGTASSSDPNIEIVDDQVVTTQDDVETIFPGLLAGNDSVIGKNTCESTVDLIDNLPPTNPPQSPMLPEITQMMVEHFSRRLPEIRFVPRPEKRHLSLDNRLPFCGRDIIFVHGFIDETLKETVRATVAPGQWNPRSLASWPQDAAEFIAPDGYFHEFAYERWINFIQKKLGPAYANANTGRTQGPRFLITAWPTHQRMEVAVHAVLTQIANARQYGTGVMTISPLMGGAYPIVDADTATVPFGSRGCIIVSHSTGGPVTAIALSLAGRPNSRPWVTPDLRLISSGIKGHVAFHPALSGSPLASTGFGIVASPQAANCQQGLDIIFAFGSSQFAVPQGTNPCAAVNVLKNSMLVDVSQPAMNKLWRHDMEHVSSDPDLVVPSVIIAGAHPTVTPLIHWVRRLSPGFDDGVVPVDSQMGRKWRPGGYPYTVDLPHWGALGVKYFDRGSDQAKAVGYFIDQNKEFQHQSEEHAGGVNPCLSPTGMILKDASFGNVSAGQVPAASSGLPNYFSFLQSTSTHFFPRRVGGGSSASPATNPPTDHSYNYQDASFSGGTGSVYEESRAVFDSTVYTNNNRPTFVSAEAAIGTVPILSQRLKGDIESSSTGRYLRIRFKLLGIDKTIWIWKRQYLRMKDSAIRDEIDYTLDYAFRP